MGPTPSEVALISPPPEPLSPSPTSLSSHLHSRFSLLTSTDSPPPSHLYPLFLLLSSLCPVLLSLNPPPLFPSQRLTDWAITSLYSAVHHLRSGLFKLGLNVIFSAPLMLVQVQTHLSFSFPSESKKPESCQNMSIVFWWDFKWGSLQTSDRHMCVY